jgi:hypothetical protein
VEEMNWTVAQRSAYIFHSLLGVQCTG